MDGGLSGESAWDIEGGLEEEEVELGNPLQQFWNGINPINVEEWPDMGIIRKIYEVFKVISIEKLRTHMYWN